MAAGGWSHVVLLADFVAVDKFAHFIHSFIHINEVHQM